MYTVKDYMTKKQLKLDVEAGVKVRVCQASAIGDRLDTANGKVWLEGPHYPRPHTWYAEGVMKDGVPDRKSVV